MMTPHLPGPMCRDVGLRHSVVRHWVPRHWAPRNWAPRNWGLGLLGLTFLLAQCAESASPTTSPGTQDPPAGAAQPARSAEPQGDVVRLLLSGSMLGRLEPCGCASGQLGGLARRMQHIGENRTYDLLLEGGDMVDTNTELDLMKMFTATQVLFSMGHPYDVLGVGGKDLTLPLGEWTSFQKGMLVPVVASDLQSNLPDWPGTAFVEKKVRNHTVRIGSLTLGLEGTQDLPAGALQLLSPAAGWQAALAGAADSTLRVLLLHTDETTARKLVPEFEPAPDLVVCFDRGYVEPSPVPQLVNGVPLVFPGIRGRVLLAVSLQRLTSGPRVSCELIPLAGSKTLPGGGGDQDVKQVLLAHRQQVKDDGVLAKVARQHQTPNGAAYVGSETCRTCHPTAYAAWEKTRHFQAWDTLVKAEADPKRYGWPVTHYPDCVSCHVVGFGEQTGFVSYEDTPQLAAVGCERCHGPGSDHMASGGTKKLGIHGGAAASVLCTQCHDFEQSPDFLYSNKWPLIQHGREPQPK